MAYGSLLLLAQIQEVEIMEREIRDLTSYCVGIYSKRLEVELRNKKIVIFNEVHIQRNGSFRISTCVWSNADAKFIVMQEGENENVSRL